MRPDELLKTVYLGDRAVKTINLDGFGSRVSIQVDEISRIRSASGLWEYYNAENIVDGLLVFTQVLEVRFDPPGPLPNDYINDIECEFTGNEYYKFQLSVGSVDSDAKSIEIKITILCKGFHLEDPSNQGVEISS